jgi:hypothetical protein
MATGQRIAVRVSVALLAAARIAALAAAMLAFAAPARADCFSDLVNAIGNTANAIDSPACQKALSESAIVVSGLTVAFAAYPNLATQVCNAVNDFQQLQGLLQLPELQDAMIAMDGFNPVDFAQCACDLNQGISQVPNDVASCVEGLLCDAQNAVFPGSCVGCTPSPPAVADCAATNADCETASTNNIYTNPTAQQLTCTGTGPQGQSTFLAGPNGVYIPGAGIPAVQQVTSSTGTSVIGTRDSCGSISYCFCPKPMVPTWTPDAPENFTNPNNCTVCQGNAPWYIFSCNCPGGTHPDPSGLTVEGISVCLCDGTTNQVANLSSEALFGPCPPPACPTGQVRPSGMGKCVTPCSNPTMGMTPDGACCDPNLVTDCGQCCPQGSTPEPNGTCFTPGQTQ